MTEVLEAVMMVCFGLSWPISLIKNIKSRTAKTMNLSFNLLIILGYLAGIAAKIASARFGYVFAIYLFNLLVVSSNVAVYFKNKRLDKRREALGASAVANSDNPEHADGVLQTA